MEPIPNLLSSYLNSRAAILRAIEDKHFSTTQLREELNLSIESIRRRRKKPEHWRAEEISHLAKVLGVSMKPERYLVAINQCLQTMEPSELQWLRKGIFISRERFQTLLKDSNEWRYSELIQLHYFLQSNQPGLVLKTPVSLVDLGNPSVI